MLRQQQAQAIDSTTGPSDQTLARHEAAPLAQKPVFADRPAPPLQAIQGQAGSPGTGAAPPAQRPAGPQPARPQVLPGPTDRRGGHQPNERMIGRVTYCSGARATISTAATNLTGATADFWAVGRLISIEVGKARVVALVYEMRTDKSGWDEEGTNSVSVHVEIVGEVSDDGNGGISFKRGVSRYPQVGAIAHKIRTSDLEIMHDLGDKRSVEIGRLTQNEDVPATVSVEDMLRKHFAVVGTTGVGKSCSVTLLVRQCLAVKPELRVLILDPHNEFSRAFDTDSVLLDSSTLELPYWLFKFDEIEDVVFRGKVIEEEADILRELIGLAKAQFHAEKTGQVAPGTMRKSQDPAGFTADSPTPYRMADLFKQIEDLLGLLEPRFNRLHVKALRVRLEGLANDVRYAFMFPKGAIGDNFAQIVGALFRLPANGRPISIINLSGLPSEVINAVVAVLARLSFDVAFASEGTAHVMLVCEEAHRYVPQDPLAGFMPARRAIARIAKEGRKYGCSIAVVSQRPGELDPTILSQCSTVFAMRLSNDRDQEIIRSAISDSSSSTISFLSALDNREAIVFGEGVATPMRFKFTFQESAKLPSAPGTAIINSTVVSKQPAAIPTPDVLVGRLRAVSMGASPDGGWVPSTSGSVLTRKPPQATTPQESPVRPGGIIGTTAAGTPIRATAASPNGLRPGGW
jgi:uncharacterized protein